MAARLRLRTFLAVAALAAGLAAAVPITAEPAPVGDTIELTPPVTVAPDLQREDTFLPQNKLETIASLVVPESAPTVVRRVLPAYPAFARLARLRGMVYARLLVDETGKVVQVGQIRGHVAFREAVKAAACEWEFAPARQGSLAVRAWVTVPFSFEL